MHGLTQTSAIVSWWPSSSLFSHIISIDSIEHRTLKPGIFRFKLSGLLPDTSHLVTITAQIPNHINESSSNYAASVEFRTLALRTLSVPQDLTIEKDNYELDTYNLSWRPVVSMPNTISNGIPVGGYSIYLDGVRVHQILNPIASTVSLSGKLLFNGAKLLTIRTLSLDGNAESKDSEPIKLIKNQVQAGSTLLSTSASIANQGGIQPQQQQQQQSQSLTTLVQPSQQQIQPIHPPPPSQQQQLLPTAIPVPTIQPQPLHMTASIQPPQHPVATVQSQTQIQQQAVQFPQQAPQPPQQPSQPQQPTVSQHTQSPKPQSAKTINDEPTNDLYGSSETPSAQSAKKSFVEMNENAHKIVGSNSIFPPQSSTLNLIEDQKVNSAARPSGPLSASSTATAQQQQQQPNPASQIMTSDSPPLVTTPKKQQLPASTLINQIPKVTDARRNMKQDSVIRTNSAAASAADTDADLYENNKGVPATNTKTLKTNRPLPTNVVTQNPMSSNRIIAQQPPPSTKKTQLPAKENQSSEFENQSTIKQANSNQSRFKIRV